MKNFCIFAKYFEFTMSLQITNLTKKFGEQTALNNINLSIEKNEIVGLLGPNGAGKSTLMKSITGVVKIDEGEILFNDKDITQYPIESKKNIGFLPENNPLYQEMFVKEYLNFVADIHEIPSERIDEVIELVGITPEKSKKISQLSKGYKQRVGLAQAILHQPDLLILEYKGKSAFNSQPKYPGSFTKISSTLLPLCFPKVNISSPSLL